MINKIYKDNLKLNISTGPLCNYHCSYCIQNGSKYTKNTIKEINEQLDITTKNINSKLLSSDKFLKEINYQIGFIGGEPTLYNLPKFINNLTYNKKLKQINIATNLSADITYFKEIYNLSLKNNFKLNLKGSYHYDMIDYSNFLDKLRNIKKIENINVSCNFVVTNSVNKKTLYNFVKDVKELNINYSLTPEKNPSDWKNNLIDNNIVRLIECLKNKKENGYTVQTDEGIFFTNINGLLTKFKINSEPILKGYKCFPNISIIYNGLIHRMCGENQYNINTSDNVDINKIINYNLICQKEYCQGCTFYKIERFSN